MAQVARIGRVTLLDGPDNIWLTALDQPRILTHCSLMCYVDAVQWSHIVESCPLTKLNGGLSRLHSADEDAVSWLTSYGSWHAYEKKKSGPAVIRQTLVAKLECWQIWPVWSKAGRGVSLGHGSLPLTHCLQTEAAMQRNWIMKNAVMNVSTLRTVSCNTAFVRLNFVEHSNNLGNSFVSVEWICHKRFIWLTHLSLSCELNCYV